MTNDVIRSNGKFWSGLTDSHGRYLLAQIVEHHDVGVHVEEVVAVRRVLLTGPLLRFGALVREHVIAVLGLVIHAVKAGHLEEEKITMMR